MQLGGWREHEVVRVINEKSCEGSSERLGKGVSFKPFGEPRMTRTSKMTKLN